jgi:CubicO group peptidase (beta-lactamase class C family)
VPSPQRKILAGLAAGFVVALAATGSAEARPEAPAPHSPPPRVLLPPEIFDSAGPIDRPDPVPEALRRERVADLLAEAPAQDDPFAAVDVCANTEFKVEGATGAAVAIMQDGQLVYEKGFGAKSSKGDSPVDAETQFRIGSVTKMFTAAAVMQQVEAGKVDLQAPITKYIPDYRLADPGTADAITTWHLLTHSSALPDNGAADLNGDQTSAALTQWAQSQGSTHRHAPPGIMWNYSNPNFMLAALVAERASGVPYHSYMAEQVFQRAGLANTTLLPAEVIARDNYTLGYYRDPSSSEVVVAAPDSYDNWSFAPAGYAFSTVGDLARWAQLLMNGGGDVLQPGSVDAMTTRQISLHTTPDNDYGFGIFREKYKGLDVMQHGGNIPGWGAYLLWIPAHKLIVATLVNAYPATLDDTAYCAVDALLKPVATSLPNGRTPPADWNKYVGAYEGWTVTGAYYHVRVRRNDTQLTTTFLDVPIDDQGTPFVSAMRQIYRDFWAFDSNGDGVPDAAMSFVPDPNEPGTWWYRVRGVVMRKARPTVFLPFALRPR